MMLVRCGLDDDPECRQWIPGLDCLGLFSGRILSNIRNPGCPSKSLPMFDGVKMSISTLILYLEDWERR